jgi:hypothetical protein
MRCKSPKALLIVRNKLNKGASPLMVANWKRGGKVAVVDNIAVLLAVADNCGNMKD